MNTTVDGEFQRYAVESERTSASTSSVPTPAAQDGGAPVRRRAAHAARGGHDYRKLYSAYKAATEQTGAPTVILAKTIKGWTLGPDVEGRNATHQIKKMTIDQLRELRERLYLQEVIPEEALADDKEPPYIRFGGGSIEHTYLMDRRRRSTARCPAERCARSGPSRCRADRTFSEVLAGSGKQEVSTTMAFTRLLRNLCRDPQLGHGWCRSSPTRPAPSGWTRCSRSSRSTPPRARCTNRSTPSCCCRTRRRRTARSSRRGITEAGSMATFIAAATSYAHRGVPMLPFFTFYSMFGFQRVGDLIWSANDSRARGFLLGATAGRTTLLGEGLQHQDGHSLILASTLPRSRPGTRHSPTRWRRSSAMASARCWSTKRRHPLPHAVQRELRDAPDARRRGGRHHRRACTAGPPHRGAGAAGHDPVLRHGAGCGPRRPGRAGRALGRGRRPLVGHQLQAAARGGPGGGALEPAPSHRAAPHASL